MESLQGNRDKKKVDEILKIIRKRQWTMPRNGTEYIILNTKIRYKCRQTKECLNKNCSVTETTTSIIDMAGMHKRKEITEQKMCSSTVCIKSKEGSIEK